MIIDTDNNSYTHLAAFKAAGVTDIGRYISPATGEEKVIKPGEAHGIADAGLRLFLIFEQWGRPKGIGQGHSDGEFALRWAKFVGAPKGAAIYYTVDYDAGPEELPGIVQAFTGFKEALGGYFELGAYASGYICSEIHRRGLIKYRWLTMSSGFRGSREALAQGEYELRQLLDRHIAGLDVDPDQVHAANGEFGSFVPFAAPHLIPIGRVNQTPVTKPVGDELPPVVEPPAYIEKDDPSIPHWPRPVNFVLGKLITWISSVLPK